MKDKQSEKWFSKPLQEKLDQYEVTVPDFPIRPTFMERLARCFFTPAKNPLATTRLTYARLALIQSLPPAGIWLLSLGLLFMR
ncbi:MAG: hypothetical protein BAA01_10640 [Bacillus thermozeamaize]|jgi:hypothetical protein|uniref:Uncharacterized protein n=1 Tax=Bacillus thermozeamaize TaxID=230954 RepID=A0A1Y3PHD9_9BACI|nr:MAG: hypothetical protein BAA01_10640 [Bacillus thermozeamaize]